MLPLNVGSYVILCLLNTCYNRKSLLTNLIAATVTFIFVAWAFALYNSVRTRFRLINSLFTQMLLLNTADKKSFLRPVITGDTLLDELLTIVTKLSQQHQRLGDCVRQINQIFALQLLAIISVYFAMGSYGLFFFIRGQAKKMEGILLLFLTYIPLFWTMMLVALVLVTLSVTTAVVKEAKQTGIIVNRIIRRIRNDVLVDQVAH
jgi:7tm Chemosensory receptor